jgi:hypothetical protein
MSIQAPLTDQARLERGYRRVLACYPRSFRRESEDEIVAVLMSTASAGQRRVGLAEAADLIRGALRMRLRPSRPWPRAVSQAVRLMCAGAIAEVAALVTMIVTTGSVRAAILAHDPGFTAADWHGVQTLFLIKEIGTPIGIFLWLWMAWANGRGHDWARAIYAMFFMLLTANLLISLGEAGATYAPADLIAGSVLWAIGLAALVLLCCKQSWSFFRPEPARAVR